ncbi:hypothetical protein [Hymenobacter algoricola]|uniref:Uncharacterized protein n=1 Tax=Hymenobacter algoricola TaxID=486267 RepID=A0ABP7MIF5_9BACT
MLMPAARAPKAARLVPRANAEAGYFRCAVVPARHDFNPQTPQPLMEVGLVTKPAVHYLYEPDLAAELTTPETAPVSPST